jgi:hypothetical protein
MRRNKKIGTACVIVFAAAAAAAAATGAQSGAATPAASTAAKASPELVGALSRELGSSPEQAAGAAGALFSVAKSRLNAADFGQVASAVPGMDSLLGAAPKTPAAVGTAGALSQLAGSAGGGLASVASAFSSLGLKPELVAKAVPVLTSFVSKSGGAGVGNLLAGALK